MPREARSGCHLAAPMAAAAVATTPSMPRPATPRAPGPAGRRSRRVEGRERVAAAALARAQEREAPAQAPQPGVAFRARPAQARGVDLRRQAVLAPAKCPQRLAVALPQIRIGLGEAGVALDQVDPAGRGQAGAGKRHGLVAAQQPVIDRRTGHGGAQPLELGDGGRVIARLGQPRGTSPGLDQGRLRARRGGDPLLPFRVQAVAQAREVLLVDALDELDFLGPIVGRHLLGRAGLMRRVALQRRALAEDPLQHVLHVLVQGLDRTDEIVGHQLRRHARILRPPMRVHRPVRAAGQDGQELVEAEGSVAQAVLQRELAPGLRVAVRGDLVEIGR